MLCGGTQRMVRMECEMPGSTSSSTGRLVVMFGGGTPSRAENQNINIITEQFMLVAVMLTDGFWV